MLPLKRLLCTAIALSSVTTLNAEKPFEFNNTPGKLPKQVVPQEYAIRIVPDVAKFTFSGSEAVTLDVREPVRRLVLNAVDLAITRASLDGKELAKSTLKLDPKEETLTIALANELPAGSHTLSLDFTGKINQQGQGLFYAPYQEPFRNEEAEEEEEREREREQEREKEEKKDGEDNEAEEKRREEEKEKEREKEPVLVKKVMIGTQLEATDARRFFPCWDEPSFRARFQLTVILPETFTAFSNMPIEKSTQFPGGKEIRFEKTPPMSTYLNVLCAGELETLSARVKNVDHFVVATLFKVVWGRYALDSSQQILSYYNDYFGVPYPLPKIAHIGIPGGFGGAMENWGGITYYESKLLYDAGKSSASTKQDVFEVVAHETAHMWFGDLVTMAWWDNLWLNEGFASWMGSKCTAKFNPDWEVWQSKNEPRDPTRRSGIGREAAMESDARSTTHPIQQPIATEAEANNAFDDIIYKKGMGFIAMLESYLGEDSFRDGIRKYIDTHKYSNTTTADLWNALSAASGKPVGEIASAWTEQPGFPIVKVTRDAAGKITLSQERFTVHYNNPPPLEWKIPVTYSVAGETAPASLLMTGKTVDLPPIPKDRAVKLNVGGASFYRVQYDDVSWKLLIDELPKLPPADRVNLMADAWALVQANRAPLSHYLDLVQKLPAGTELAEHEQIIHVFDFLDRLLIGDPQRESFQKYACTILRPAFDRLGWNGKRSDPAKVALLRASLVTALGLLNDKETVAGCRERFEKFLVDEDSLLPDLRAPVFAVVGRHGDEATWKKLHELGLKTTNIEEKQNYYYALAYSIDPKLIARTLELSVSDELPTSRATYLVSNVAKHSDHPELAWQFAKTHLKQLLGKTDALAASRYAPALFTFFSDPARITELERYAKSNLPPGVAKDVAMAVDEIGFRAEFKERLIKQTTPWQSKSDKNSE